MSEVKREQYSGRECLCPLIVSTGRSEQTKAREGLPRHFHSVFEFCLITKGSVDWWVAEKKFHLAANSVFVTKPGERHGSLRGILEPCVLNWIMVDHRQMGKSPLRKRMASLPVRISNIADRLLPYMDHILDECRRPKEDSREIVEANLLMFLSLLVRHAATNVMPVKLSGTFQAIRKFISSATDPDLTVLDICNQFDLNRSHVHRLFVRHLGMGPQAYLIERKLKFAANLLAKGGKSITEIAHQLNFSSSQHFATAFKRHYGMSPREWKKPYA